MSETNKLLEKFMGDPLETITSKITSGYYIILHFLQRKVESVKLLIPSQKEIVKLLQQAWLRCELSIRMKMETPYRSIEKERVSEIHFKGSGYYELFSTRPQNARQRLEWRKHEICFLYVSKQASERVVFGWFNQTVYLTDDSGTMYRYPMFNVYEEREKMGKGILMKDSLVNIQHVLLCGHMQDPSSTEQTLNTLFRMRNTSHPLPE